MRLLITGAQGYIGSRVSKVLIARGHHVTALARSSADKLPDEAATLIGDLEKVTELAAKVAEFDGIGHFAASQAAAFGAVNARFVEAVLGRLSRGQVFAMQSGSLVFGPTGTHVIDESAPFSPPPFLAERASLEQAVSAAGASGPRTVIVYASMVHGGRGAMIPGALVEGSRRVGRVVFPGDGNQSWSTVHVDDWAALIVAAMEAAAPVGERYFAAGPLVSIRELAQRCAIALKLPTPVSGTDEEVASAYGFLGTALALDQRLSGKKALQLLRWNPSRNDLQHSFNELIA